jgi:hypothetical protein
MNYLQTNSGKALHLSIPQPGQINFSDIWLGLARAARFNGQLNDFCSVLNHSWMASIVAQRLGLDQMVQLRALLHDVPEAYIGDMPQPLKRELNSGIGEIEVNILEAVYSKLGIVGPEDRNPIIEEIDVALLFLDAYFGFDEQMEWLSDLPQISNEVMAATTAVYLEKRDQPVGFGIFAEAIFQLARHYTSFDETSLNAALSENA